MDFRNWRYIYIKCKEMEQRAKTNNKDTTKKCICKVQQKQNACIYNQTFQNSPSCNKGRRVFYVSKKQQPKNELQSLFVVESCKWATHCSTATQQNTPVYRKVECAGMHAAQTVQEIWDHVTCTCVWRQPPRGQRQMILRLSKAASQSNQVSRSEVGGGWRLHQSDRRHHGDKWKLWPAQMSVQVTWGAAGWPASDLRVNRSCQTTHN